MVEPIHYLIGVNRCSLLLRVSRWNEATAHQIAFRVDPDREVLAVGPTPGVPNFASALADEFLVGTGRDQKIMGSSIHAYALGPSGGHGVSVETA